LDDGREEQRVGGVLNGGGGRAFKARGKGGWTPRGITENNITHALDYLTIQNILSRSIPEYGTNTSAKWEMGI
jgi:hypothetical protein